MPKPEVILQPGREKPLLAFHHWIFPKSIQRLPQFEPGEILPVYTSDRQLLGHAYFNRDSFIVGRMLSFGDQDPIEALKKNMHSAAQLRKSLFDESTNTYRVINGEGDYIPGLIVDRYADVLVIQVSTLGMEKLKPLVIEELVKEFEPKLIYEKSNIPARKEEGLELFQGVIYGEMQEKVKVKENDVIFEVDIVRSHKTGLYLDQREMRQYIASLAKGKKLLNCFCYTGGFSLYAARAGAAKVDSVDISEEVIKQAEQNFKLNKLDTKKHGFFAEDVFKFLHDRPIDYDIVILDPPAFAKKKADVGKALTGYREINRAALRQMPAGSLLLTCSCSYHVDEAQFTNIVMQAAKSVGKKVRILQKHRLASDHPLNIFQEESDYLKSLLLYLQ